MKVLYVTPFDLSASNVSGGVFADRQICSLENAGVDADVLVIRGNTSFRESRRNFQRLRRRLAAGGHDVVHAQYGSVTALVTCLAGKRRVPVVVSFCGSDLNGTPSVSRVRSWLGVVVSQLAATLADGVICKSEALARRIWLKHRRLLVMPNGVDLAQFRPLDRQECRRRLGIGSDDVCLLFNNGNGDPVKRLDQAEIVTERVARCLPQRAVRLLVLRAVAPSDVVYYLNAANVLLITSDMEGSPNILKEAIACRTPVVSYPVGDAGDRLAGVTFGRVVPRDPIQMADAVRDFVLDPPKPDLDAEVLAAIDQETVAKQILEFYRTVTGIEAHP